MSILMRHALFCIFSFSRSARAVLDFGSNAVSRYEHVIVHGVLVSLVRAKRDVT